MKTLAILRRCVAPLSGKALARHLDVLECWSLLQVEGGEDWHAAIQVLRQESLGSSSA